jgi:hypothetical protein
VRKIRSPWDATTKMNRNWKIMLITCLPSDPKMPNIQPTPNIIASIKATVAFFNPFRKMDT